MRSLVTGVTVLVVAGAAGCAPAQDAAVRTVGGRFYAAYAAADGARACDELAPRTRSALEQSAGEPCAMALLEEQVPHVDRPTRIQVFGTQAEIKWPGETTFLARFDGGWKVTAAACTPRAHKPYECSISGG